MALITLPPTCDIDFNNDTVFPDMTDVVDLITVFGAGACSTGNCDDIDINNDDVYPDISDVIAYIDNFGGGC